MPSRYTSFLIRHWQLVGGASRITIEHIQSGETVTLGSFDEALSWLGGRVELPLAPGEPPRAAPEREATAGGA
jgi:hypothetical protein